MGRVRPLPGKGRRLKGLDEFEKPAFVGRMTRLARRRRFAWWAALAAAAGLGAVVGWFVF